MERINMGSQIYSSDWKEFNSFMNMVLAYVGCRWKGTTNQFVVALNDTLCAVLSLCCTCYSY